MEPTDLTASQLATALARRELSCVELAGAWIRRTEAAAALNCYVEFDAEGWLAQARRADARLAAGERLPLLGVPIALKDNIAAAGLGCASGTAALQGWRCERDAPLVARLRAAGAVITGKLGMHELAFGITSNNACTGAVHNPWDPARSPGGSSGGAGAAVAARLVPVAIGTDTGGSVRVPAAFCGVQGLRPSVGRVSAEGIAPISATRDTAGPLARSVEDLALLDSVLGDEREPLERIGLRGLRLGIPDGAFWQDLAPGVQACADRALEALRAQGAECVPVALPGLEQLNAQVSFVVALHEFVRDMTRYLRDEGRGIDLAALVAGVRSADVKAIVEPLLGAGAVPESAYRDALAARRRLQGVYREAFAAAGVDALVFPTTPCTAPGIGEDQSFAHNGRDCPTFPTVIRNTDPGSNAGLPGISLAMGLAGGLPVGLELDGPAGGDRRLLAVAAAVEAALPAMPAPPTARAA